MSLPPFVYQHGIQTVKYLYDLYGYDQLIKHIEVIHHIYNSTTPVTPITHDTHVAPVAHATESIEEPVKNIIIQSDKPTHSRPELTDETQCKHLVRGGQRCAVRRKKGSDFCLRHSEEK